MFLKDSDLIFEGRSTPGEFGHDLIGLGDQDGDGWNEIVVGAPDGGSERDGEALVSWSSGWP